MSPSPVRFTQLLSLAAVLAATSLIPAPAALAQVGGIAVGASAPSLPALATVDGAAYDLSSVIGKKPVVIEFWATWCPLCRKLEPSMAAARKTYGDRVAFVHIGVPDNQTAERQKQFVTEKAMQGVFLFDADKAAMKAFAVPHTSYVVALDAAGKVVYTGVGGDQDIDAAVRRVLPAK